MNPDDLQVGADYRTRDGRRCRIYGKDIAGEFSVLGVITVGDRADVRTFLPTGRYSTKYPCDSDLIGKWERNNYGKRIED